jgi:signal peptidase I
MSKSKKSKTPSVGDKNKKTKEQVISKTFGQHVREWADALVIAFVLAMFIRTFVAELYKIPTGSMIPTLVGGPIAEWDVNGDGRKDYVASYKYQNPPLSVFYKEEDGGYSLPQPIQRTASIDAKLREYGKIENHLVLVNKFAYLFKKPDRGEIVIFKVPEVIYQRDKPIYIKRCIGLPGEKVSINDHRLYIDGELVEDPPVFERIWYQSRLHNGRIFTERQIPDDEFYVFGDNSRNSYDCREWGGVNVDNLRGRAVLRPWPIWKFKFL